MYAIIESGGKQFRVNQGDVLLVEKLEAEAGATVLAERVLAVGEGDQLRVGNPELEGARVSLKVLEHGKGKKIIVYKYKSKKNYRRKQGHRQPFSRVQVESIEG